MKAIGVDIGTAFIASARYNKDNIVAKYVRDGFFVMPFLPQRKHMLQESKVPFIIKDRANAPGKQDIYVIGNEAFDMAVLFGQELRRPLASGVISAKERDTEFIIKEIIRRVAGQGEQGDVAYFSVPANPVDADFNNIYHREMFKRFLSESGYMATPIQEGMAVAWSELEDKELTGLAMSCLTPGQRIFTDSGFKNIEAIVVGQRVLTKEGVWAACTPTKRHYSGKVYKIRAYGGGKVELTSEHLIWIMREGVWQWVAAKDIKIGDCVKQPWRNGSPHYTDKYIQTRNKYDVCRQATRSLLVTNNAYEFLGHFLGDGHAAPEGNISITIEKSDTALIDRIKFLFKNVFDIEARIESKPSNAIKIAGSCKTLATWLRKNCYDDKGVKKFPWDISELKESHLRFLLKGLIETDGHISKKDTVVFVNTSGALAQTVYLAMARLGLFPSYSWHPPLMGGVSHGKHIIGKKDVYVITASGFDALNFIRWMRYPTITQRPALLYGSTISIVGDISVRDYDGYVYDVSVEGDDHSFCVPGIAIHNCGAGMINASLSYRGLEVFSMSSARAGDYIDKQVAQSRGIPESDACAEKEAEGLDLLDPKGDVQEAIAIFYRSMLEYSIGHISRAMDKHRRDIKLKEPLNFVVAGGTTMPKGFLRLLVEALKENPLPIPVGKVWQAKNPVMAVCRGCLKAAQKLVQDETYDGVRDISGGQNTKHAYPQTPKEPPPEPEGPKKDTAIRDKQEQHEKAKVVNQVMGGGFAEAIDLSAE